MALFSRHHSSELPEVLVSEDGTISSSLLVEKLGSLALGSLTN